MIIDRIENRGLYTGLGAGFALALDWLARTDVKSLAAGRYELDGERVFALVQDVRTRPTEQCRLESHRLHHDVQFVVSGAERMGYANVEGLVVSEPYEAGKDVGFFEGSGEPITVRAGMFAIFTPADGHAPLGMVDQPSEVRKVVVKVRVSGVL